jgi:6-pyruvoyltetrahydropterin/6-carboxytetrahydropterin synthase
VSAPELDKVGRVMDFSIIKEKLCMWLEDNWDHKFLAWKNDTIMLGIFNTAAIEDGKGDILGESIVWTPFNPTAEQMAKHLVNFVGPQQLAGTGCTLVKVVIEETRKCSVTYTLENK